MTTRVKEFIERYHDYISTDVFELLSLAVATLDLDEIDELCSILEELNVHYKEDAWKIIDYIVTVDIENKQGTTDLETYLHAIPNFKIPKFEVSYFVQDKFDDSDNYEVIHKQGRTIIKNLSEEH